RPVPTREEILRAADERLLAEVPADLGAALGDKANGDAELGDAANGALVGGEDAARVRALGERMLEGRDPADVVAWLLARGGAVSSSAARDVAPAKGPPSKQGKNDARGDSRSHARGDSRGDSRGAPRGRGGRDGGRGGEEFITYQVSWGAMLGADVRRILAMVCRRGDITHAEVGAIHVSQKSSTVDIAARVAAEFEVAVERPDDRPPKARFRRWNPDAARGAKGEGAPRKEFRGREGAQKGKAPRKPGRPRKVGPKAKHAPLHDLAAS
ncbi:MAG: DbpA RNA binding domain-containing protein, partial [Myxococcales bacterium]|nr:DbpA RNA binding domain-containing protein [Myxococcales bacterium]